MSITWKKPVTMEQIFKSFATKGLSEFDYFLVNHPLYAAPTVCRVIPPTDCSWENFKKFTKVLRTTYVCADDQQYLVTEFMDLYQFFYFSDSAIGWTSLIYEDNLGEIMG